MSATDIETSVEHGMIDDGCTDASIASCARGIKAAIWMQENLNNLGASNEASAKLNDSLDGAIELLLTGAHSAVDAVKAESVLRRSRLVESGEQRQLSEMMADVDRDLDYAGSLTGLDRARAMTRARANLQAVKRMTTRIQCDRWEADQDETTLSRLRENGDFPRPGDFAARYR